MRVQDHIIHLQRRKILKGRRRRPQVRFHDDDRVGIDSADRLRRHALNVPVVVRRPPLLNRLIEQVIPQNGGIALEALRHAFPAPDVVIGVFLFEEHGHLTLPVPPARGSVHIENHFDAVLSGPLE